MLNRYTIYKFIVRNNKVIKMKYESISCSLYDRIESLAVLKKNVKLAFVNEDNVDQFIVGEIANILSRDNAEFLIINNSEIRLDKIKSIDD